MATVTVKNGNYGSYLYIDYSFSKNTSARTWSLSASLNIVIPNGYTFGPWDNYYVHSANLEGNGMPSWGGGTHTLDTWSTSGRYNANGDAPSVSISWAFNVRSSWAGYWEEHGSITATGESIGPDGTPPTGLTATLVEAGPDWADITVSISSWGSPSTSATRYIESAVLGSSAYGNPYKFKTATAVMSATLHVDNTCSGNLTIVPNTQYRVGCFASNQTRHASTVGAAFTTLPAVPAIAAVDQGHGVIDFTVTHANEGSAQTVAEEYSADGGTTWTAISGGAFTLTLATQTEVIVKRSSTAGESTAAITVVPQFDVGIYGSASDKTVAIRKVYAPAEGPRILEHVEFNETSSGEQVAYLVNEWQFVAKFNSDDILREFVEDGDSLIEARITYSPGDGFTLTLTFIQNPSMSYAVTNLSDWGLSPSVDLPEYEDWSTYDVTATYRNASVSKKIKKVYASVAGKTKLVFEDPS